MHKSEYFFCFPSLSHFPLKTLLSESSPQENRWPPELILLREKFTAKSQLEIAQLQIKHEEEVSFASSKICLIRSLFEIQIITHLFHVDVTFEG